jgi:hypothetical protein
LDIPHSNGFSGSPKRPRMWRAAPGKFEVKRLRALEHSNNGITVSFGGYSTSNFTGSAPCMAQSCQTFVPGLPTPTGATS